MIQMSKDIKQEVRYLVQHLVKDVLREHDVKLAYIKRKDFIAACRKIMEDDKIITELIPMAWDECKMRYEAKREAGLC